ncbi:hypothetical protein [Marinobacterium mangrovicola]|uniref:Uncharacterized protein n=1 Tax=Marinobacterium mangrovicola TaxID=1476959 RepID=A0A4V2PGD9_9GAMM|nr:hypothetical protein [Marinobacterium mangrovicola]TCK16426.1 hypothetical protein CLV83_0134 [Marinobacterium mangrovicola]
MNKRLMVLILIALSIGVTWYIESARKEVPAEVRDKVAAEVLQKLDLPAQPVWWDKGHRLGIGVIPDGSNRNAEARDACSIMLQNGITPAEVEVFDVLQIQNDDDWVQIGAARCE